MNEKERFDFVKDDFFKQHSSVLLLSQPEKIRQDYLELIEKLNKFSVYGMILNFNKPSIKEKSNLNSRGISVDRLTFIDAVTVNADFLPDEENILLLLKPDDLDGVKTYFEQIFSKETKPSFLVIDLLDVLLYYNSVVKIITFIEYLKSESSKRGFSTFVFSNNQNKVLLDKVISFFDRQINLS